jgi:hypothetical protein
MSDKNQIKNRQMLKKGTAFSIDFIGLNESKNQCYTKNLKKKPLL